MPVNFDEVQLDREDSEEFQDDRYKFRSNKFPSVLTDRYGNYSDANGNPVSASVPEKPGYVFHTPFGDGVAVAILNRIGVPAIGGYPIYAGYEDESQEIEVLGVNYDFLVFENPQDAQDPGEPPSFVYPRDISIHRTSPVGGMNIQISPFTYFYNGQIIDAPGVSIWDMSSYLPAADKMKFVGIYYDHKTKTYAVVNGTEVAKVNAELPPRPNFPEVVYPTAYLLLYDTTTDITDGNILDTRLFIDDTEDRVRWRGDWSAVETYQADDMVVDGVWAMIANKETQERAGPQPVGQDQWLLPDNPTWDTFSHTGEIRIANEVTVLNRTYIVTRMRFYVPTTGPNYEYNLFIGDTTSGTEVIPIYISQVIVNPPTGWNEFDLPDSVILAENNVYLFGAIVSNDSATTPYSGQWERGSNSQSANPPSGQWNRNNQSNTLRINKTDFASADRSADLAQFIAGTTVTFTNAAVPTDTVTWLLISGPTDTGSSYTWEATIQSGVEPAVGTLCDMDAEVPIPGSTDVNRIQNYWLANPNFRGVLVLDGGIPTYTDDAWAVDFYYDEFSVSDDWDFLAYSGSGGVSGGGGASTLLALSDTPISYVGEANNILAVNPGETGMVFIPQPSGGVSNLLGLTDTPSSYIGQALRHLRVNAGETAVEFTDAPPENFTDLTDTPADYIGQAGLTPIVNIAETALIYQDTKRRTPDAGEIMVDGILYPSVDAALAVATLNSPVELGPGLYSLLNPYNIGADSKIIFGAGVKQTTLICTNIAPGQAMFTISIGDLVMQELTWGIFASGVNGIAYCVHLTDGGSYYMQHASIGGSILSGDATAQAVGIRADAGAIVEMIASDLSASDPNSQSIGIDQSQGVSNDTLITIANGRVSAELHAILNNGAGTAKTELVGTPQINGPVTVGTGKLDGTYVDQTGVIVFDVDNHPPTNGDTIRWNGTKWAYGA